MRRDKMLKSKNKVFQFTFFISILFHALGFGLIRIKGVEANINGAYVEVGLFEAGWQEPFVDLPGSSEAEQEGFLEIPRHLRFNASQENTSLIQQTPSLNLPEIKQNDNSSIESLNEENKNESLDGNSSGKATAKQMIEGPAASRKILLSKNPSYPEWAENYGLEFEVKLKFWILANGEVGMVSIERSSGYPEMDAQVVQAMKRWRFNPVEVNLESTQWGTILFKFRLET